MHQVLSHIKTANRFSPMEDYTDCGACNATE